MDPLILLEQKLITEDPESPGNFILNVPLYITGASITNGGFELFAGAYGWRPTPLDATNEEIDANSPISFCLRQARRYFNEVLEAQVGNKFDSVVAVQKKQIIDETLGQKGIELNNRNEFAATSVFAAVAEPAQP